MERIGISFILIASILLVSTPFVLGANPQNDLLQTIIDKLTSIFEQLEIIADKNETVEVLLQPNITVLPPEIIINPNITLPDKECEWEKFNQHYDDFGLDFNSPNCCGFWEFGKSFQFPLDIRYSDVTAISGRVYAKCNGSGDCKIRVNEVECLHKIDNNDVLQTSELSQNCIDALNSGKNNISMISSSNGLVTLEDLYIESEVKPANC